MSLFTNISLNLLQNEAQSVVGIKVPVVRGLDGIGRAGLVAACYQVNGYKTFALSLPNTDHMGLGLLPGLGLQNTEQAIRSAFAHVNENHYNKAALILDGAGRCSPGIQEAVLDMVIHNEIADSPYGDRLALVLTDSPVDPPAEFPHHSLGIQIPTMVEELFAEMQITGRNRQSVAQEIIDVMSDVERSLFRK